MTAKAQVHLYRGFPAGICSLIAVFCISLVTAILYQSHCVVIGLALQQ